MKKVNSNETIIYWGTVLPLLALIGMLYVETKNQHKDIERGHKVSNRQIELINLSYQKKIKELEQELEKLTND